MRELRKTRSVFGSQRNYGITLVELLVTLGVVGILGAFTAPQFSRLFQSVGQTTAVNDLMHDIYFARSRAVMTNGVVSICASADGVVCSPQQTGWEVGWIVFQNLDRDQPALRDANEPILERHGAWQQGHIASNRRSYSFRAYAQADVNGTLVFCAKKGTPQNARAVIISHTGRPRVAARDASNHALVCPPS